MKKIHLFLVAYLIILSSCTKAQVLCCRPIIIGSAGLPDTTGLVNDFNFSDPSSVTQVSGKVASITDAKSSAVSAQSTSGSRPTYHTSGGPNGNAYANFNGSQTLTGSLLTSSSNFTAIVIRRVATGSNPGDFAGNGYFQNGAGNTGYGMVDWEGSSINYNSGGYFNGVTSMGADFLYTDTAKWQIMVFSHSSGSNKLYNTVANQFTTIAPTTNPVAPSGGHTIGGVFGVSSFKGDIERILLYNRQLSDSEVSTMCGYLTVLYQLPVPVAYFSGGDSITAGTGNFTNYPFYEMNDLRPANYIFLNQTGVPGRTSADVLAGLNSEVLSKYVPGAKNIYTLMIGHNDFSLDTTTARRDTLLKHTDTIIARTHRKGFKVIVMNTLRTTAYAYSVTDNYNTTLTANVHAYGADSVVNIAGITQLQDATNMTYFSDGTHPTQPVGSTYISNLLGPVVQYYITH